MKLFKKKKTDSRSRRTSRLRLLQLRQYALTAVAVAIVGGMGFAGYHSVSFRKIGEWASAKTLATAGNAGFKVKNIIVTGRLHTPPDELAAHIGIRENMPILGLDISATRKSLLDIPWIQDVSIARRLPDQVVIELKERVPAALWQYQKKISVIDREGVVLTSGGLEAWQSLPFIVGEDAPKHITELLGLLHAEPELARNTASAVRIGGRRWDLHLKNKILVKLPERDVELAMRRLALEEERHNILKRNIGAIDLRQPDRMTVTPLADGSDVQKTKKTIL